MNYFSNGNNDKILIKTIKLTDSRDQKRNKIFKKENSKKIPDFKCKIIVSNNTKICYEIYIFLLYIFLSVVKPYSQKLREENTSI